MMPTPTATATWRGSFTGDRRSSCANASSDISLGDGRVAVEPRLCQRAAARSFPGRVEAAAVRGGDVRGAAREPVIRWWISTRGSGAVIETWRRYTGDQPGGASTADASPLRSARPPAARDHDVAVDEQALACSGQRGSARSGRAH